MNAFKIPFSRRGFLLASTAVLTAGATNADCDDSRLLTPYKYGKLVLSGSGKQGDFDSISVDCPFVFRYDNQFFMTYVAFDGVGYQTGLASSPDLISWRKEGCILKRDPVSPVMKYNIAMNWILRENGLQSEGKLKKVGDSYLGVYHAYPNAGYEQGAAVIGLCRSKDLRHWAVEPPCLLPENGAAWEHGGLYKPCLVEHEGKYHIFYNAKNRTDRDWREQTGVAVSTDLKRWTRYAENPIIRNGAAGSPDERFASDPCVLQDGKQWAIFYFGLDAKGVARDLVAAGPDLFRPAKCSRVLIDIGPPGSIDSSYAHKPSVIQHQGNLYHFYCAVSKKNNKEIRGISFATSKPLS
jgi:predicted GH43/DUF377 family glycosyl hydrolase